MGKGGSNQREALSLKPASDNKRTRYQGLSKEEWEYIFSGVHYWFDIYINRFCEGDSDKAEKRLDPLVKSGFLTKIETITNTISAQGQDSGREIDYEHTSKGEAIEKRLELKKQMNTFNKLSLEAKDLLHYLATCGKLQNQFEIAKDMGLGRKLVSEAMAELIRKGFVYKDEPSSYYGGYTSYRLSNSGRLVGNKLKADLAKAQVSVFS